MRQWLRIASMVLVIAVAVGAALTPSVHAAASKPKAKRCQGAKPTPRTTANERVRATAAKASKPRRCTRTKPKPKPAPHRDDPSRPDEGKGQTPANDLPPGPSLPTEPPSPPAPGGGGSPTPAPELNAVGVRALDRNGTFVYETTRATVRSGALTVSFRNDDSDDHNLWIEGTAPLISGILVVGELEFRGNATTEITLAAGTYRFFCSVPGHGTMTKQLRVTA